MRCPRAAIPNRSRFCSCGGLDQQAKEAAYLLSVGNSEELSKRRAVPYTLARSVSAIAIHENPGTGSCGMKRRNTWRPCRRRQTGLLDLSMIQPDKYEEAIRQGISKLWEARIRKQIPRQKIAADWDGINNRSAWKTKGGTTPGPPSPEPTREVSRETFFDPPPPPRAVRTEQKGEPGLEALLLSPRGISQMWLRFQYLAGGLLPIAKFKYLPGRAMAISVLP